MSAFGTIRQSSRVLHWRMSFWISRYYKVRKLSSHWLTHCKHFLVLSDVRKALRLSGVHSRGPFYLRVLDRAMSFAELRSQKACISIVFDTYLVHQAPDTTGYVFDLAITSGPSATPRAIALYQSPITVEWESTDLDQFTPVSAPLSLPNVVVTSSHGSAMQTTWTGLNTSAKLGTATPASSLTVIQETGIGVGTSAAVLIMVALIWWLTVRRRWTKSLETKSKKVATKVRNPSKTNALDETDSSLPLNGSTLRVSTSTCVVRWSFRRHLLMSTWFPEILAAVFSTACLFAIMLVLGSYDGRVKATFSFGITLNALISVLSTASKASLLYAIGAAVRQLKWVRLTTIRRLEEITLFDEASRGPLGATILLARLRVRSWASVGAITIILALIFEPFVQQVLKYPIRPVSTPNPNVVAKKASVFAVDPSSNSFVFAVNSALWTTSTSIYERTPSCPSGNCDWPAFTSMEWCSKCADVTASATLSPCDVRAWRNGSLDELNCTISLGHGDDLLAIHAFNKASGAPRYRKNLHWTTSAVWTVASTDHYSFDYCIANDSVDDVEYLGVKNPMLVLAYARVPGLAFLHHSYDISHRNNPGYLVEECVISLCTQKRKLTVRDGKLMQNISYITFGFIGKQVAISPDIWSGWSSGPHCVECWQPTLDNIAYRLAEPSVLPSIDINVPLTDTFRIPYENKTEHAICAEDTLAYFVPLTTILLSGGSTYQNAWFSSDLLIEGPGTRNKGVLTIVQHMGLQFTMEQIAASLTKVGLDTSNETVTGNMTTAEVYVHVQWVWLSLPIVLELIGIVFLAVVITLGRKHNASLWKCSLLPLVFHSLEEGTFQASERLMDIDAMEDSAKRVMVRISNVASSEKLVVASQ